MRMIRTRDDLDISIRRAEIEGCSWFKLYNNVDLEIAKEAASMSHKRGLKITCHLDNIGLDNAIKFGFHMIEHLATVLFNKPQDSDRNRYIRLLELWDEVDEGTIEDIADKLSQSGIAVSTTLALIRGFIGGLRVDKRKYSRYIVTWYRFYKFKNKEWKRVYKKIINAVRIFWEKRVPIVSGTDIPNQALTPGLSLWEELDILMEAGLGIWEALTTATGLPSRVIGSKRGRILEGQPANIIILEKIPNDASDLNYMSTF